MSGAKVARAKTAFIYYSTENFEAAKRKYAERHDSFQIGEVSQMLSRQWARITPAERKKYEDLAAEDMERFVRETAAADAAFLEEQARRRAANVAAPTARTRKRAAPVVKPKRKPREVTPEEAAKRAAKRAARRKKTEVARAVRKTHEDERYRQLERLRDEHARSQRKRLRFLLGQSDIFKHFMLGAAAPASPVKGQHAPGAGAGAVEASGDGSATIAAGSPSPRRRSRNAPTGSRTRKRAGSMGDSSDDEAAEQIEVTRLTRQPTCITGNMRDYQLEGLNWMIQLSENGLNGILADEMGLGKTLQTISLLGYTLEYKKIRGPHIVLVPKSTLANWMSEIKRWCPQLRPLKFHGSKEERAAITAEHLNAGIQEDKRQWDVLVTTYEVANIESKVLDKFAWRYLVIDEAHRIKNENSSLSQVVRTFVVANRLLLTGTPLQNNLHELWSLLNFLLPDVFGSAETFGEWFDLQGDDDEAKKSAIGKLHRVLRPFMLRRLKKEVAKSIPPKTETILYVPMTKMQRGLYRNILRKDFDAITGGADRGRLNNLLMQMRKCCNHPYLFEGVEDRTLNPLGDHLIANCGKLVLLDKLLRRLQRMGSRVLIFSQMTRLLDILEDFCFIKKYDYCRIDGNSSYDVRESSIDAFNMEGSEKFIFLLSTRAGGLGINLATADTVILYDSDWNPQVDLQAQDRAHRIGQTKPVSVYRFVTEDSVEVKVVEKAYSKLKLDAVVVQQGRLQEKQKQLSKKDMLEMVQFGASSIIRAGDGSDTLTDEDIDAILTKGKARTAELNSALEEQLGSGDGLLDFSLDGSGTKEFEGVDYTDQKKSRKELERLRTLELMDAVHSSMGKRERKAVVSYAAAEYGDSMQMPKGRRRGVRLKGLPKMHPWQFWNVERMVEIAREQLACWKQNQAPPPDLAEEKAELVAEAFGSWLKADYHIFVDAMQRYGRYDISRIHEALGGTKSVEEVERYADTFWRKGPRILPKFDKIKAAVERGEAELDLSSKMEAAAATRIVRASQHNPWYDVELNRHARNYRQFTADNERFLLAKIVQLGFGNWKEIQTAVQTAPETRFDHWMRSRTLEDVTKRASAIARWASKENARLYTKEDKSAVEETKRAEELKQLDEEEATLKEQLEELQNKFAKREAAIQKEIQNTLAVKPAAKPVVAESAPSTDGAAGGRARKAPEIYPGLLPALARIVNTGGKTALPELVKRFTSKYGFSARLTRLTIQKIGTRGDSATSRGDWKLRPEYEDLASKPISKPPAEGKPSSATSKAGVSNAGSGESTSAAAGDTKSKTFGRRPASELAKLFPADKLPALVALVASAGKKSKKQISDEFFVICPDVPKSYTGPKVDVIAQKERRSVYPGTVWFIKRPYIQHVPTHAQEFHIKPGKSKKVLELPEYRPGAAAGGPPPGRPRKPKAGETATETPDDAEMEGDNAEMEGDNAAASATPTSPTATKRALPVDDDEDDGPPAAKKAAISTE